MTSSASSSSRSSRTLPTRKSKAALSSSTHAESKIDDIHAGFESRQESKMDNSPGSTNREGSGNDGENRVPSPPNDTSGNGRGKQVTEMQPAFVLKDMATIDHPSMQAANTRPNTHHRSNAPPINVAHPQQRRSPSPTLGSVISRRGRSRSPVGLTPHGRGGIGHISRGPGNTNNHNNLTGSRPTSRASNGRDGRSSAATIQASGCGGNELSDAALAAGEAAAGVVERHLSTNNRHLSTNNLASLGGDPYHHHHHQGGYPARQRSPSPVGQRFPSASMSFEISPQQSMSFCGGDNGSFDWNGPVEPPQQYHHGHGGPTHGGQHPGGHPGGGPPHGGPHGGQHPGHHGGRRRSLSPAAHHGGRYNHDPNSIRYNDPSASGRYQDPNSRYPHHNYPPAYSSYHANAAHHNPHHRGRTPSPPNGQYPPPPHHHGHHNRHHSRSNSPINHPRDQPPVNNPRDLPRRNSQQQALFPEHHIQSPHDPATSHHHHGDRTHHRHGPTKKNKRSSKAPQHNNETHRSSVFRGSPTPGKDNLPQELLLALEEEDEDDTPPTSPEGRVAEYADNDNTKEGRDGKGRGSNGASPITAHPLATLHNENSLIANPSMVDNQQIDACLQDTINLNVDDYLNANLSFRKSYDLEQVFSFIKEGPNGGQVSGYGPGDMKLGNLSFNLGFSESRSNDEGDHRKQANGNDKSGGKRDKHDFLPTIHTLRSQSMGLTPINSFSGENKQGSIVPMSSNDGMALRAFFSSSPTNVNAKPASSGPTNAHNVDPKVGDSGIRIGSPHMNGRHGPPPGLAMSLATNAPVVHASTPPSYNHHQPRSPDAPPHSRYHGPQGGPHRGRMNQNYSASTPPHGPSSYRHGPPSMNPPSGGGMPFPNKRIKLSSHHSLHPMVDISKRSANGDFFVLLREMAPCFGGFRFKLPEMESSANDPTAATDATAVIVGSEGSPQGPTVSIAKRRISSSLCAFGGSLALRTVSFDASSPRSVTNDPNTNANKTRTESPQEQEERHHYEEQLSSRYFMKEHCISWDVELHEVIAPKMGMTKRGRNSRGKAVKSSAKQIGHFKKIDAMGVSKYCAPVTPHTPSSPGNSPGSSSTSGTSPREKGSKIKYRCKLCGQPKQNHTCTYQSSMVRSIGTMVYPAVNAFVSNEPGRLAPALSEMNNFTSLLSNDTSMGMSQPTSGGPPSYLPSPHHAPIHHNQHHRGAPYNVLSPDTSHWSPNTPGGLSTMSSCDANSPGAPPPGVGGPPPGRKRDHNHLLMSRSMTRTMSQQPPSPPPRPPAAPAGAIPNDVLFRDTMELKKEQYRTVNSITTATGTFTSSNDSNDARNSPNAYRYPPIPTPYSHRKEMGDTLFALSREVPKLADSCAAILREARENDLWDQAVAELTTQVLVVLKCEDRDYTLEGLRRHLLTLGIAC